MTATLPAEDCERREDLLLLDNEKLTYRARGLLLHLSTHYTPGTQIAIERLALGPGEGVSALRGTLHELADQGYLRRGRGTAWVFQGDPTRWTVQP